MGKKDGPVLGRNLLKSKAQSNKGKRMGHQDLHTTDIQDGYDWGRLNLQSVTADDNYTDFMTTAEMAGRDFDDEKWNVKLLDGQTREVYIDTEEGKAPLKELPEEAKVLPIPRRPQWTGMTAEQLKEEENKIFLEWRRNLASIQEEYDCVVTPYEKNLEFWRQLWRVIERSDLVVQIVDSRHPLLYRSLDLEKYVKEVSTLKKNMVLINKADFLTEEQREAWADYFEKENINFAFFSAVDEEDQDEEAEDLKEEGQGEEAEVMKEESQGEETVDMKEEGQSEETEDMNAVGKVDESDRKVKKVMINYAHRKHAALKKVNDDVSEPDKEVPVASRTDVLSCDQMVAMFRSFQRHEDEHINVGFIGYPNVGKSSTINKLLRSKKVRVSQTPGKTKHFQTLPMYDDLTLCDCPGLVMPSICNSKAGMILHGILPIDQLRDHVPVTNLLLSVIPPHVLESKYGLVLPREDGEYVQLSSELFLGAYGTLRGFMTAGGRPDQSRAARLIIKDYCNGKLLHCAAPPEVKQETYHIHDFEVRRIFKTEDDHDHEARRLQCVRKTKAEVVDGNFFDAMSLTPHVQGSKKLGNRLSDKNKRKKKARIVYADLDPKRHGHI